MVFNLFDQFSTCRILHQDTHSRIKEIKANYRCLITKTKKMRDLEKSEIGAKEEKGAEESLAVLISLFSTLCYLNL